MGDAESSLGDAESSLGDAKSSLGDAKSSLGDVLGGSGAMFVCRGDSSGAAAAGRRRGEKSHAGGARAGEWGGSRLQLLASIGKGEDVDRVLMRLRA
jgi:hypothetical protein